MNAALDYYNENAAALADRYDALSFDEVHRVFTPFLPSPPAAILDIGAGSGRDAIALADRGFAVTAVEPASAMLSRGQARAHSRNIEWFESKLPELSGLEGRAHHYAFILCSAVLMHLPSSLLRPAFCTIHGLAKVGCHIGVTVRPRWSGDPAGLFHDHSLESLSAAAHMAGLRTVATSVDADRFNRAGLTWRTIILTR